MREILFRGRRKDDSKWIEGYYCKCCFGRFPCDHAIVEEPSGRWEPFEIIAETLGQYTGLTDKNGTKIFEGDILQDIDGGKQVVVFEFGAFYGRYLLTVCNDKEFYHNEVIGNIYDNPELLK